MSRGRWTILAALALAACKSTAPTGAERTSYQSERAAFQTTLIRKGPSPQPWTAEAPPDGVREVRYPSDGRQLKAWVWSPAGEVDGKRPALVYFHGGFAFGRADMDYARPFVDAGYVVMFPMLRGENGNPGHFELFFGEVDDGKAAVEWLAGQPNVDRERVYTFGHSAGGAISALLSLVKDAPIRHGGSAGGLYPDQTLLEYDDLAPFDVSDPDERRMRRLLGHLPDMQRKHFAFVGTDDYFDPLARIVRAELDGEPSKLVLAEVPGDHNGSLRPAVEAYLQVTEADKAP